MLIELVGTKEEPEGDLTYEYIEIYKKLKLKYPNKKAEIIMIRFICRKLKEIK